LRVEGGETALLEALGERQHVGAAEGVLELCERAQREAEAIGGAIEARLDLAAVGVGHGLFSPDVLPTLGRYDRSR
jgi:hypothetical protein